MGSEILKADRDHDLYCVWDSTVDAPTVAGTREEIAEWTFEDTATIRQSKSEWESAWIRERVEKRLTDADEFGSSAYRPYAHRWGEDLIYEQRGILPRDKLYDFLMFFLERRGDGTDEEFDISLLKPRD